MHCVEKSRIGRAHKQLTAMHGEPDEDTCSRCHNCQF